MHLSIVIGVYIFYLDQSPLHFLSYLYRSFEIASGYSQFMRVGDRRWSLIIYLAAIAAIFAWHCRLLRRDETAGNWRAVALASCAAPVLFIAMKQGYTRQDGHEVASYIVVFVYASLVACSARLPARFVMPVQAVGALGVALAIHVTQTQDLRAGADMLVDRLSGSWSRAIGTLALLDDRARGSAARAIAERNRGALIGLQRTIPIVTQLKNYDIFAPEQTLAALSPENYRPRPVFQGYSAYTPTLQDLNARHVERVPDQFLVNFRAADNRYPNLEDGSALAQIAMQFCPDEWYGWHVSVRRTGPQVELSALDRLGWRTVSLISGDVFELPDGVVLGEVAVELTLLGRLMAAVYRLPELVARLDLSDDRVLYARLIPTGREYPAILSPLLENTHSLARLWSGTPGAAVTRLQLRTSPVLKLLIEDLTVRHAVFDWSAVARKCAAVPAVAEPPPPGALVYEVPKGANGLGGIDAHPSSTIAVPTGRASRLVATLRLRAPERTSARSDGVGVRIYGYRYGAITPLIERRIAIDEFGSSSTVTVFDGGIVADEGYLVFETWDQDPTWDWFEWEQIRLR